MGIHGQPAGSRRGPRLAAAYVPGNLARVRSQEVGAISDLACGGVPTPSPARVARFSGEAVLAEPCTPFPELEKLVKEIIGPLATQPDVTLTVRVEIEASHAGASGFSDQTIRTVSENARTLRLRKFDFEKE